MRICILGPVTTSEYWGGVASFDEGIAEAAKELGHQVLIISTQNNHGQNQKNPIICFTKPRNVIKMINKFNPDQVIASLEYGKYFRKINNSGITKTYFLHGYFNYKAYGRIKTLLAVVLQRHIISNSDKVISNSFFTKAINDKIWNLPSNKVVWLGVDTAFMKSVLARKEIINSNSKILLYSGRLVEGKGIEKIVKSFISLNRSDLKLVIIGDGPLQRRLKELSCNTPNITLIGKVSHENIFEYYQKSEIFISLNETEPFGLTFLEALLAGCKIICPHTGGQVEYLLNFPDRVAFVNPKSESDIKKKTVELLNKDVARLSSKQLIDQFNMKETVKNIIE